MLQAKKPGSVGRIKRTEDMYGYIYIYTYIFTYAGLYICGYIYIYLEPGSLFSVWG